MVCVGPRPHLVFGSSIDGRTAVNSPQRVSDLLDVSRPTIDRMADDDLSTALARPALLEGARTSLAETTGRGSTAEEREAAGVWLQEAARDEHYQVAAARCKSRACHPPVSAPQPRERGRDAGDDPEGTVEEPPSPCRRDPASSASRRSRASRVAVPVVAQGRRVHGGRDRSARAGGQLPCGGSGLQAFP